LTSVPHLGELLALLTAVMWAVAVIFFKKSGETVHPFALNLFKSVLGGVLILATIWLMYGIELPQMPRRDLLLLLASGALGIGIADTLFFKMLNRLGAALTSIVDCLYSPMVILAAMIWLGETLSVIQVVGVALIISAVLEAVWVPRKAPPSPPVNGGGSETPPGPPAQCGGGADRKHVWVGVLWGVAAMACMALSIVIMKPMFERYSLLWVMEYRLAGGLLMLAVIFPLLRERRAILRSLSVRKGWGFTFGGAFIGQYLALLLWAAGIKFTQASLAAAINQTSNVFVFVLAGVFLKERLTKKRIIGIALAIVGVYLVTFG